MTNKSELEETLLLMIKAEGLPLPEREIRFHNTRRWRFDFAYPSLKIGIECEGGTWTGKGHAGGKRYRLDCEKYDWAALMGWKVLRFTKGMIDDGEAIELIKRALKGGK